MSRQNVTVKTDRRSLSMIALVIGLLALPGAAGLSRGNAEAIRELEHRRQAAFPPITLLFKDARQFVQQTETFLKDAIGFRHRANALYRKTRCFVFGDPPLPNITIGRSGHLFLNGPHPDFPYDFVRSLCVEQGDPSPELLRRLDVAFAAASRYFTDRGARTTIALVPTTLALYADKLPLSVPAALRRACLDYPKKDHALAQLARRGEAEGRYRVFYPHALFTAHKGDPYFYPKECYHCEGESATLFIRHLLKESGAVDGLTWEEPAALSEVSHDIGIFFGFGWPVKAWTYSYETMPTKDWFVPWVRKTFGGNKELLARLDTENGLTSKTALLIGNSFGAALCLHLAKGFRSLYFLNTNNFTPEQNQASVFAAVAERVRPDFVYFIFDDLNVATLPRLLAGFVELEREAAHIEGAARNGAGTAEE